MHIQIGSLDSLFGVFMSFVLNLIINLEFTSIAIFLLSLNN